MKELQKSSRAIIDVIKKCSLDSGMLIIFIVFILSTFGFFLGTSFDNQSVNYLYISGWDISDIFFKNYGDQLPLWFLFVKMYTSLFGTSEIVLKLLPALTFLLSAYVLFKLAEIYKVNRYLVTILYLSNPLLLKDTAYIFKHWSFLILLNLASLYFFEKLKETNNKNYILPLCLIIIAGIYSNLVFLLFLSALMGYLIISVALKQMRLRHFGIITSITVLSVIPLYYYYEKAKDQLLIYQGAHMDFGVSQRGMDFIKLSLGEVTGINYLHDHILLSIILITSILLLIVFKMRSFKKNLKDNIPTLWLASTVIFIVLVLMFMASHTPVRLRYLNCAIPLFYLAIFPKSKKIFIAIIGSVLVTITVFASIQMAKGYDIEDWKGVSSFIAPTINEDSQVLMIFGYYVNPHMVEYYLGSPVKIMNEPNREQILSAIYSDDVWVIIRSAEHDAVYSLATEYRIEEFNYFDKLKLIHLVRKNGTENKNLIFDTSRVEIQADNKTDVFEFKNGSIFSNCCKESWQRVRIDSIKSGDESNICLFVHPRENANVNLIYEDVELQKQIALKTGLHYKSIKDDLSPVYMDIFINDNFTKRIIHPNSDGWVTTEVDTSDYNGNTVDIKMMVTADNVMNRHFCIDAEIVNKKARDDYFYTNLPNASASFDNTECNIFQTEPIWPHNESEPPYLDSKIFERWDCEENLIEKSKIWHTVGRSYAISNGEYREAIWMHPATGKHKSLRYEDINISTNKVTGYYGISDHAAEKIKNTTLTFTITINGETAFEDEFEPSKGWKYFEIPTEETIDDITFDITTTNDKWNHFFFNSFFE